MKLIELAFALFCVATPAAAEAAYQMPAQPAQVELTAPLPDWQQVLYTDLADSPQYAAELAGAIQQAAAETEVPAELIWGVAVTESHGRQWNDAGLVKRGSAGEVGLMQVKPFWARAIKREYGIDLDLWQVADNVRAGAYILKRGGGDPATMLSYYNTGKHIRGTRYQRRVTDYVGRLDDLADARPFAQPAPVPQVEPREVWPAPPVVDATATLAGRMAQADPDPNPARARLALLAHWVRRVARQAAVSRTWRAQAKPLLRDPASRPAR